MFVRIFNKWYDTRDQVHGEIESLEQSATRGLSMRVLVGGATGVVSSPLLIGIALMATAVSSPKSVHDAWRTQPP